MDNSAWLRRPLETKIFSSTCITNRVLKRKTPTIWPSQLQYFISSAIREMGISKTDFTIQVFLHIWYSTVSPLSGNDLIINKSGITKTCHRNILPVTNDKHALHILSCALVLEASAAWHSQVYCSEIGHDDKLFTSDCWQWCTLFFLSCLLALMSDQEEEGCKLHDKMLYPPLTFTWWESGGDFRWNKAPVSIGRCVAELLPSVLHFSSFFRGRPLAGLWQRPLIRKWLSIMGLTRDPIHVCSAEYKESNGRIIIFFFNHGVRTAFFTLQISHMCVRPSDLCSLESIYCTVQCTRRNSSQERNFAANFEILQSIFV